ncbi:MAG: beta-propeller fold lactonase family protein [Gemmataceae bacterium]
MRTCFTLLILPVLLIGLVARNEPGAALQAKATATEQHRSPVDFALLDDGKLAVTANHTSDSVSLVDLDKGVVLDEARAGRKPSAIACTADGKLVAVSNLWSHALSFYSIDKGKLQPQGELPVGAFPRALRFSKDGSNLYVCLAGEDRIAVLDVASRKELQSLPAAREPRHLALSEDGKHLACASSKSSRVRCFELPAGKLLWERKIIDAFNMRDMAFTPDGAELICVHVIHRSLPVSHANIGEGWVLDSRLTRFAVKKELPPNQWQLALDFRGEAVGDPHGLAYDASKRRFIVSASGTHELMMIDQAAIPWSAGDPGDHMPFDFSYSDKVTRFEVGGRPMTIALRPGNKQVVAANYLLDALQVIDLPGTFERKEKPKIRTIALGGPGKQSSERRGEALFYDAQRSHAQWFSCHSCHTDGHTDSLLHDTLNDETYGNDKLTPTLRGVARTAPYTWHGWQDGLEAAVEKSFHETLFGPEMKKEDIRAVVEYLKTLEHPPHPFAAKLDKAAVARGKGLFADKAGCLKCHHGDEYISKTTYDLGLTFLDGSAYRKWNPPSLRGLYDRGPYMHDARAVTLEDLLEQHHKPESLGGEKLTPAERKDLIVFLKSL